MANYNIGVAFRFRVDGQTAIGDLTKLGKAIEDKLSTIASSSTKISGNFNSMAESANALASGLAAIGTNAANALSALSGLQQASRNLPKNLAVAGGGQAAPAQAGGVAIATSAQAMAAALGSLSPAGILPSSGRTYSRAAARAYRSQQAAQGQPIDIGGVQFQPGMLSAQTITGQQRLYALEQQAQRAMARQLQSVAAMNPTAQTTGLPTVTMTPSTVAANMQMANPAIRRQGALQRSLAQARAYLAPQPAPITAPSVPGAPRIGLMRTFAEGADEAGRGVWSIRRAGFDLQAMGRQMQATGVAVAAAFGMMTKAYADFNYATTRAGTAMELPITLMGELESGVKNAAIATGKFSPTQVAEGLRLWAAGTGEAVQSQTQLNRIMEDTITIQKLAAMNNVDLEETMSAVGGTMAAYEIAVQDVERVTSVFNFVAAKSFANVDDLGEAFTFVGPVAAQMGVSFEETAAALALLSDQNIKGSMAGRAFRQMMITLLKPTDAVNAAMTDMLGPTLAVGQSWQDVVNPNGKFVGLAEYFDMLAASVENLTSAERNEKIAQLATANALPGLISLINDQVEARKYGVNIFSVYTKLLQNNVDEEVRAYKKVYEAQTGLPFSLEGAMARMEGMWQTYRNSAAGQMDALKQAWNVAILDMAKPVAEVFIPMLADAVGKLTDLSTKLSDGTGWVAVVAGVATAVLALGTLFAILGKILQTYATLVTLAGGVTAVQTVGLGAGLAATLGSHPILKFIKVAGGKLVLPISLALIATTDSEGRGEDAYKEFTSNLTDDQQAEVDRLIMVDKNLLGAPWVARNREGESLILRITGSTNKWVTSTEKQKQIVDEIVKGLRNARREAWELESGMQFPELSLRPEVYPYYDSQYHGTKATATNDVPWTDDQQKRIDAQKEFEETSLKLQEDYVDDSKGLVKGYNDWLAGAERDLGRSLAGMASDYARTTARNKEDFDLARGKTIESYEESRTKIMADAYEEREKAARDYYESLQKLERDHQNRMVDLLEARDVQGITKEMRDYDVSRGDLTADFNKGNGDRERDIQKQLEDARVAFEKQIKDEDDQFKRSEERRAEDYALQRQAALDNFATQKSDRDEALAQEQADLKLAHEQELYDLAMSHAAWLREMDSLVNEQKMRETQLLENSQVFADELLMTYSNLISSLIVQLARLGQPIPMEATRRPAMSEDEYQQGLGMRANGGYAARGNYKVGERGTEFVLNPTTTRDMEDRFGYLSQSTFGTIGGHTFVFSPNISGFGTQDTRALDNYMNRWWKTAQRQVKEYVR